MTQLRLPAALSRLSFVVVDVEGNGQQPPEIVEIAALRLTGTTPAALDQVRSWLVRPARPITRIVTAKAHGITDDDVADSPPWKLVRPEVVIAVEGRILIAHHATVERNILATHIPDLHVPAIIDTVALAKKVWPDLDSYRLDRLIDHAQIPLPAPASERWRRHRAAYDTWATAALFTRLAEKLSWEQIRDTARIPTSRNEKAAQAGGLW